MSTFDPGTSGTLKSTTIPAAFVEAVTVLQNREAAITTNPPDNVTVSIDVDNQLATLALTLPITFSLDGTGKPVVTASDYLTSLSGSNTFVNGSGDLASSNLTAAVLELAQTLHAAEKVEDPEIDNIQISYDLENSQANMSASIPLTVAVNSSGKLEVTVTDYV
ncbi:hypothetical protein STA3757_03860 [Stanieria sp. NIES-3757]|nr:hypothetical protein STA3757_03860 [Stanieria sp. NIES-3757]